MVKIPAQISAAGRVQNGTCQPKMNNMKLTIDSTIHQQTVAYQSIFWERPVQHDQLGLMNITSSSSTKQLKISHLHTRPQFWYNGPSLSSTNTEQDLGFYMQKNHIVLW